MSGIASVLRRLRGSVAWLLGRPAQDVRCVLERAEAIQLLARAHEAARRRRLFAEPLEERIVLAALPSPVVDATRSVLDAIRDEVRNAYTAHAKMQSVLPIIGERIGDKLDLGKVLSDVLYNQVDGYLNGAPDDTTLAGFLNAITYNSGGLAVNVNDAVVSIDSSDPAQHLLNVSFTVEATQDTTALEGSFPATAVFLDDAELTLRTSLDMPVAITIPIQSVGTIAPEEVFVDLDDTTISASVTAFAAATGRIGLLDLSVSGSPTLNLNAQLDVGFTGADASGRLSLTQLTSGALGSALTLGSTAATLNVNVPVSVAMPGLSLGASPALTISIADVFAPAAFDWGFSAGLAPAQVFVNMTEGNVLGLLSSLASTLDSFASQLDLDGVPFLEEKVSDIIDLSSMITDFTAGLTGPDSFTFDSFQELVAQVAGVLGVPVGDLNLRLSGPKTVLIDLPLSKVFSETVVLDLSEQVGPVQAHAGVEATFEAAVEAELTLGFVLDPNHPDDAVLPPVSELFFVDESSSINVSASVNVPNFDLGVSVGPLALCVVDGNADFSIATGVTMDDPGVGPAADGRVFLSEIIAADEVGDVTNLVAPTIDLGGEIPILGCTAALNTSLGINPADPPKFEISLGTPNDIGSLQINPNVKFNDLLNGFGNFSDLSMFDIFVKLAAFLDSADIGILNTTLPLINISINEALSIASDLLLDAGGLNIDFGALKLDIQGELPALDAAIALAVPSLTIPEQDLLFKLREAINVALNGSLPDIAVKLTGIWQGFEDLIPKLQLAHPGLPSLGDIDLAIGDIGALLPSLNTLETRIEGLFGLAPGAFSIEFDDLANGDRALIAHLTLTKGFLGSLDLGFGFEGQAFPIGIESGGTATADFDATLQLDFGVNLDDLLTSPLDAFFILDSSSAVATANISVANLVMGVTIGGVTGASLGTAADPGILQVREKVSQAFTSSGSATFALSALTADQIKLAVVKVNGVVLDSDDYTLSATQLVLDAAAPNGQSVEVIYPGANPANVGFEVSGGDADGKIPFSSIGLGNLNFTGIDAVLASHLPVYLLGIPAGDLSLFVDLSDLGTIHAEFPDDLSLSLDGIGCDPTIIIDGLASILGIIRGGLESDILTKLPIIGGGVSLAGSAIGEFESILNDFKLIIGDGDAVIQQFLYDNLGPGGLNVLYWDNPADGNPNAVPITSPSQIDVSFLDASGDCLAINLNIVQEWTFSPQFDLGLGGLAFGVQGSVGVDVTLGFDLQFGFGIDTTNGFYFSNNTDPGDEEFEVGLEVALAPGSSINANLFFLELTAEENPGGPSTGISGSISLDVIDPNDDGKLTISEISDGSLEDLFDFDIDAQANVDLLLSATLGGTGPGISANLFIDWQFNPGDGVDGSMPLVEIRNVSFEFGSFLTDLLGPAFTEFNKFIEPIKPILDFLTDPIPVVSDLSQFMGGDPVTPLDIIELIAGDEADTIVVFVEALATIADVVGAMPGPGGSYSINFGSLDFDAGVDFRDEGTSATADDGTMAGGEDTEAALEDASSDGFFGTVMGFVDDLRDIGLSIPILENPALLFNLLLGQRVDLVKWDIPRLSAGIYYEQSFGPLLPPIPLYARIFGGFEVFADIGIGLDTRGLEEGLSFFDGFYFRDFKNGEDVPELGLTATIGAGAELNVFVAKAGVEGGIEANIGADLNDVDDDGKVYFDELTARFQQGLECIFSLVGSLDAFVNFYAALEIDTFLGTITLWDTTINLVDVTIFEFNCECPPLPPPVLGHVSDGSDGFAAGTFVAHIGSHAAERQAGAVDDEDKLVFRQLGAGHIWVKGYGEEQEFTGVNGIYIAAGDFDDDLAFEKTSESVDFTIPITLLGGDGDDYLEGGKGADSIEGGEGNDWIYGKEGNDTAKGDGGNDVIFGFEGNDSLEGGDDDDQMYGENGNDTIRGGDGDDIVYGDGQPPSSGGSSQGNGNDSIDGGEGNDKLNGAGGDDSITGGDGIDLLEGVDGDDTLRGDGGDDVITGGRDHDSITGGEGNDSIQGDGPESVAGGDGNDTAFGDAGFDMIEGAGGADFLVGGSEGDALIGAGGNDTLLGGWGEDMIRGFDGLDYIEGGPDGDDICGQLGVDTIWGGTTVFGYPYLGPQPSVVYSGGFGAISCPAPITFTPPVVVETIDPEDGKGTVSGQKFEDLNANGSHDPGEPGLVRWTIRLVQTNGTLVYETLTGDVDLNGDGAINPETERGVYVFEDVLPGQYKVVEIMQNSQWSQSKPTGTADPSFGTVVYNIVVVGGEENADLDFGNYRKGSVTGQKFRDDNRDGKRQANEPLLNGWTIELYDEDDKLVASQQTRGIDLNGDQQINQETEIGAYRFTGLVPGLYRVVEVLQSGYAQTVAPGPINVVSGLAVTGQNFGNTTSGEVGGTKWHDLNRDGKRQSGEPGLPGVVIYVDLNRDGDRDTNEPFDVTSADDPATRADEAGQYEITGLAPGAYVVREVTPEGYEQTYPVNPPHHEVQVGVGGVVGGLDFGNAQRRGGISGVKFNDRNRDGVRQAGEEGLIRWTIYIDSNNNGARDSGEPATTTDQSGLYQFTNLPAGTYVVREVMQPGFFQTAPASGFHTVTLPVGGNASGRDFGNAAGRFEGDNATNAIYVRRNPASGVVEVFAGDNANGTLLFSAPIAQISNNGWTIDMYGGNDRVTLDFTFGPIAIPGGLTVDGGSGLDQIKIIGTEGNDAAVWGDPHVNFPESVNLNGILIGLLKFDEASFDSATGDDRLTIGGILPYSPIFNSGQGNDTLEVKAGVYDYRGGVGLLLPYLEQDNLVVGGDGVFNAYAQMVLLPAVQINTGGRLRLAGDGSVMKSTNFALADGSVMELRNGTLIVDGTSNTVQQSLPKLTQWAGNGRNFLAGGAITVLDQDLNSIKGAATVRNLRPGTAGTPLHATFGGFQLDANDVIVDYTFNGDINLSQQVDADDAMQMDRGFLSSPATGLYANGDLDYSGRTNISDFFLFDKARAMQAGQPLGGGALSEDAAPAAVTPLAAEQAEEAQGLWPGVAVGGALGDAPAAAVAVPATITPAGQFDGFISGTKFADINGDTRRGGVLEVGIPGVTIYLDTNDNRRLDINEPATQTLADDPATPQVNEAGFYIFTGLPNGQYIVREIVPEGYVQTAPSPTGFWVVNVGTAGQTTTGRDFGNQPMGTLNGRKCEDLNADGRCADNEPGLGGVTIYIDANRNGRLDAGEPTTVTAFDDPATQTNEAGRYSFTVPQAGAFVIREAVPAGYVQTMPSQGFHETQVGPGGAVFGLDFGNTRLPGSVSGIKWLDLDADHVQDVGEPGVGGVTVYIDLDNDGELDIGEPSAVTRFDNPQTPQINEAGTYVIDDAPPGTWHVREVVPAGMGQSFPGVGLLGVGVGGSLFDVSMTAGAASNVRPTAANITGIAAHPITGNIYAMTTAGDLLLLDASSGATGVVGNVGFAVSEGDLDFDPVTGRLYMMYGPTRTFYVLDPVTAKVTPIGSLTPNIPDPSAMAFTHDGRMYIADTTVRVLAELNPANLAVVSSRSITGGTALGPSAGMSFDPLTGVLFLATGNAFIVPTLYTVNLGTGALTTVGATSGQGVSGLEFLPNDSRVVTVVPGGNQGGVNFGNYEAITLPDGDDLIHGDEDNDLIWGDNGTGFPPTIVTTGGNDSIYGDAGLDQIHGQDEHDLIFGGTDNDQIWGEAGDDTIGGQGGNDTAEGGLGDDTYLFENSATATNDVLNEWAGEGSDTLDFSAVTTSTVVNLTVQSAARTTNLTVDLRNGIGGNGTLNFENVIGSQSNTNTLLGNSVGNRLTGGDRDDLIVGGAGNNFIFGRDGDDVVAVGQGNDVVYGDGGSDDLDYNSHPGPVSVNLETRSGTGVAAFFDVESLVGSGNAGDTLVGPNAATVWRVTGNNRGAVDSVPIDVEFTGFENLTGGNLADRFELADGVGVSGTIDGGGVLNDIIDYNLYTTGVAVDLMAGSATNTGAITGVEHVIGGKGDDNVRGDGGNNILTGGDGKDTLRGEDGVDLLRGDGGDDSLEGGNGSDGYFITDGGGTDTIVELPGGGVNDIVSYQLMTTPVTVDLAAGTATGVSGLAEVESFIGGTSTADKLVGPNVNNNWNVTGANAGTLNGTTLFTGFENLTGGTLNDTFVMNPAGSLGGAVSGGTGGVNTLDYATRPGPVAINLATNTAPSVGSFTAINRIVGTAAADTLTGPNATATWNVSGVNSGTLTTALGSTDFVGFENLAGGSNADSFRVSAGGSVTGGVNGGGGGPNVLDYTAHGGPVTVNLQSGVATGVAAFSNIVRFLGSAAATDTLGGRNIANTWNLSGGNAGNINGAGVTEFQGFEFLTGGTNTDVFAFANGASVTGAIAGNAGNDRLDYTAYTTPVTVNLNTLGATGVGGGFSAVEALTGGSAADSLVGANIANAWNVSANNAGTVNSFTFAGVENLTGGTLADTFVLASGVGVAGTLSGGSGNDTVNYGSYAAAVTVNLSAGTASSLGGIASVETVFGGSGDDMLVGGAGAERFEGNGGADVIVGNGGNDTSLGGNGRDILIGGAGADNLDGGAGEDVLIGGTTSHDANAANLNGLRTRWIGAGLFNARVTNLKTVVPTLAPGVTVINDGGVIDTLTGGADLDWFLTEAADNVTDFNTPAGEIEDAF